MVFKKGWQLSDTDTHAALYWRMDNVIDSYNIRYTNQEAYTYLPTYDLALLYTVFDTCGSSITNKLDLSERLLRFFSWLISQVLKISIKEKQTWKDGLSTDVAMFPRAKNRLPGCSSRQFKCCGGRRVIIFSQHGARITDMSPGRPVPSPGTPSPWRWVRCPDPSI